MDPTRKTSFFSVSLRDKELSKVQERKAKLEQAKLELEKQGLDAGIAAGLMNKLQVFVNDTQLNQIKTKEQMVQTRVNDLTEELRVSELLESYIQSKTAN